MSPAPAFPGGRLDQGSVSSDPVICIFYSKKDLTFVARIEGIVQALGARAWYADSNAKKNWRDEVKVQLNSKNYIGSIVLWSKASIDNETVCDEAEDAKNKDKPILGIFLDACLAPAGMRQFPRYPADGVLANTARGTAELRERINNVFSISHRLGTVVRNLPSGTAASTTATPSSHVHLGRALLLRPAFIFSISSFETQIAPSKAIELLADTMPPRTVLVSAFDLARSGSDKLRVSKNDLDRLAAAKCAIVVDSGNYEAQRFDYGGGKDTKASSWKKSPKKFHAAIDKLGFDFAFTHDKSVAKNGSSGEDAKSMIKAVLKEFYRDDKVSPGRIVPIVHAPKMPSGEYDVSSILEVIAGVARESKVHAIAVAERELGDGVLARAKMVRVIRRLLDDSGRSVGLHILGAGNPLSCACFALAGADSFDGLEWCRTIADWDMRLSHFQHLPFARNHPRTVANDKVGAMLESEAVPGRIKAIAWNLYHFNQFAQELTRHAANPEEIFRSYSWKTELELLRETLKEAD